MNEHKWDEALRSMDAAVPEVVHQRVEDTLASILLEPASRKRDRKVFLAAALVCAVLVITVVFGIVSPTMAQYLERLPLIGFAFKHAGDPGVQSYSEKHPEHNHNVTVTDQGIPITLDQVIYDGTRLSIGFLHASNIHVPFSPNPKPNNQRSLLADGQAIHGSAGGVSKDTGSSSKVTVYHVKPGRELTESFQLTISLDEVIRTVGNQSNTVKGNWQFQIAVQKISEGIVVKTFDPPLEKSFEGTTIAITEVVLTPVTTKVAFNFINPEKYQQQYQLHPFGEGQPDELTHYRLGFELLDERGVQLQPLSYGGGGKPGEPYRYSAMFEPITSPSKSIVFRATEETNKLKLTANGSYIGAENPDVVRFDMPKTFPITQKQGDAGEIKFHRIEYHEDKTLITYEVRGSSPHIQDGAWWVEDEAGKKYSFDRYDQIRLNDNPFTYEATLPAVDPNAKYKLALLQMKAPKVLKELEFQIQLDNSN